MITSIVGRLIKRPELVDRFQIPGKRIVLFTLVQHQNKGERRLSVFYNLSMLVGTDAQYEMVMRFEKNTVLLFSFPRITYVKHTQKSPEEQVINIYADVENFKIVAGADAFAVSGGNGAGSSGLLAPAAQQEASQSLRPPAPRPSAKLPDLTQLDDPFEQSEPQSSEPAAGLTPAAATPWG